VISLIVSVNGKEGEVGFSCSSDARKAWRKKRKDRKGKRGRKKKRRKVSLSLRREGSISSVSAGISERISKSSAVREATR